MRQLLVVGEPGTGVLGPGRAAAEPGEERGEPQPHGQGVGDERPAEQQMQDEEGGRGRRRERRRRQHERARRAGGRLGPSAAAVGRRTARPGVVAQAAGEGVGQRPADRLGVGQRQRHLGGAATAGGHRRLRRLGAADRDDAGAADLPPGDGLEREAAVGVDAGEERRVGRAGGEVDPADPGLPRQRRAEVLVRDEPVDDEDAAEPLVLPGLLGQRRLERVGCERAGPDQQLADARASRRWLPVRRRRRGWREGQDRGHRAPRTWEPDCCYLELKEALSALIGKD